jgi:O-antigen/teichoic acid export membrane protein
MALTKPLREAPHPHMNCCLRGERERSKIPDMANRQTRNIVANFSGVGARLVFTLAFNVIYFRLLGSESFGLFGFFTSMTALSSLFDLGLNQTTVREVARREADPDRAGELRSVVFTLQLVLGGIGLSLGLLLALGSPWIAASWFSATHLTVHEVAVSVAMMGFALALTFPVNFFYGTLIGLQRQVLSNAIIVAATALRGALTLVALFCFGSSPTIFFFAQTVASAIEMTVLACLVWKLLPSSRQPLRFDAGVLKATWKFSSGAWLAVAFAQVATQCDKILLSTLLPLHWFGLYSLAISVTAIIQRLAPPFTNSYFPHFVRLREQARPDLLAAVYRQACEFASALFLAAGLSLVAYAGPIAQLLSPDPGGTAGLALVLALLAAANMLNVEMALPFSLLFAHGVTAVALRINSAQCVLYLAGLAILVPHYGVNAAALLWLAANAIALPVLIVMTHRAVLLGPARSWLVRAVLLPGCAAGLVLVMGAAVMPDLPRLPVLIWISLNAALALAAALLAAPETRRLIRARVTGHDGAG